MISWLPCVLVATCEGRHQSLTCYCWLVQRSDASLVVSDNTSTLDDDDDESIGIDQLFLLFPTQKP